MNDLEARHALADGKMVKKGPHLWCWPIYGTLQYKDSTGDEDWRDGQLPSCPSNDYELYTLTPEPPKSLSFDEAVQGIKKVRIILPDGSGYVPFVYGSLRDKLFDYILLDLVDRKGWPITAVEE